MGIFNMLFGKKISEHKKKAMVYVDFEHWYISLEKLHSKKPDVKAFHDELADRYDVIDMAFFGDFSNPSLRAELQNIRRVSNTIIETQNASANFEKDFTDFIMLDHIYQSVIGHGSKEIDAYVIFTGDGHFSSAVSFLTTKCRKEVGIYAVKDAISSNLSACASYTKLIPEDKIKDRQYETMILSSLRELYNKKKGKKVYATFWGTIEASAKYNKVDKEKMVEAMQSLIRRGYIYKSKDKVGKDTYVKTIKVNWSAVSRDGLLHSSQKQGKRS
jgi:predicted metal-binding protein